MTRVVLIEAVLIGQPFLLPKIFNNDEGEFGRVPPFDSAQGKTVHSSYKSMRALSEVEGRVGPFVAILPARASCISFLAKLQAVFPLLSLAHRTQRAASCPPDGRPHETTPIPKINSIFALVHNLSKVKR